MNFEVEDKLLDVLVALVKEEINVPEAKRQILAIPGIAIGGGEVELPAFARVDVEGKPEVGRYYDGYAEISFKAGIREVVEWIEQYSHASMRDIFGDDWRAKLKEWGIE